MPGMVKVGWTGNLGEDRAKKLRTTGVPLPFTVEFVAETCFPEQVEAAAHQMLAPFQVSADREFFRVPPLLAIDAVRTALLETSSIDAWRSDEMHQVREDDRIALTTMAGDIFVVLAYSDLIAPHASPVHLWQAHADRDLLELMGAATPTHMAGLSDYRFSAVTDPVPFLDRDPGADRERRPNGIMNGRERLVPGDRLLWFRPMARGQSCALVIFEITDYCQVISRTWNPQYDEDGWQLPLEYITADEPPPCVIRATRAGMRLPRPQTWAPRNPAPDDGWVMPALSEAPPEYWLTQLAKRGRASTRKPEPKRPAANHPSSEQPPLWLRHMTGP
jgi:hypothetical protein